MLLKLSGQETGWTLGQIASGLDLSPSAIHRSLERAAMAGLYDARRKAVNRAALLEFLAHGSKYVFPPTWRGESRGIPTAWAAPPLVEHLAASDERIPVWPHPLGKVRGIALEPLHPVVPEAARRDRRLGEALALVDAIRIGTVRERALAVEELTQRVSEAS